VTTAVSVGPILVGPAKTAHVDALVTTRGIVNLSALAAVDAQVAEG
jgi:phosphotransacetylase